MSPSGYTPIQIHICTDSKKCQNLPDLSTTLPDIHASLISHTMYLNDLIRLIKMQLISVQIRRFVEWRCLDQCKLGHQ